MYIREPMRVFNLNQFKLEYPTKYLKRKTKIQTTQMFFEVNI